MKKLLSVLLALVMVLALCACGGQNTDVTVGGDAETTAPGESTAHTHIFSEANCVEPATCDCGETEGEIGEHLFSDATCEEPMTCQVCGITEGAALGHSYSDATCVEPATCSECGDTDASFAPHVYQDGACVTCGEVDPDYVFEYEEEE